MIHKELISALPILSNLKLIQTDNNTYAMYENDTKTVYIVSNDTALDKFDLLLNNIIDESKVDLASYDSIFYDRLNDVITESFCPYSSIDKKSVGSYTIIILEKSFPFLITRSAQFRPPLAANFLQREAFDINNRLIDIGLYLVNQFSNVRFINQRLYLVDIGGLYPLISDVFKDDLYDSLLCYYIEDDILDIYTKPKKQLSNDFKNRCNQLFKNTKIWPIEC